MKHADQLVSVVICTAGRPEVFGAALRSVLAQDYGDFEILILDQSRDDRTETITRELAADDSRVRYWRLEQRGLSRAYNRGVGEARGELVAFTDDDCVAPPGWLRAVAGAFAREPEAELVYGQVLGPIDSRDQRGGEGVIPTLPIAKLERLSKRDGFRVFGMGANFATTRAAWKRLGGFDEILGGGGPLQSAQVRAGDRYALFLFTRSMLKVVARMIKREVLARPTAVQRTYLSHVVAGFWKSLGFGVDRRRRLYYERPAPVTH